MDRKILSISLSGYDAMIFDEYLQTQDGTPSEIGRKLVLSSIRKEKEKNHELVERLLYLEELTKQVEDKSNDLELYILAAVSGISSVRASVIRKNTDETNEQFEKRYLATYKSEIQKMLRGARRIKESLDKGVLEKP